MNEVLKGEGDLMGYIREHKTLVKKKPFTHITHREKIERAGEELLATNPRDVMKWGWSEWDNKLG